MLTAAQIANRDMICNAALKLFERGGINAISMREIAKAMNVSAMMPYNYYPSKDHLLMDMRMRAFQRLTIALQAAQVDASDLYDALEKTCYAYLQFATDEPHSYRLMFDLWVYENPEAIEAEFGESAHRQSGSWQEIESIVSGILEAEGISAYSNLGAHIIWSTLHGAAALYLSRKLAFGVSYDELTRAIVNNMVDTFLIGARSFAPERH